MLIFGLVFIAAPKWRAAAVLRAVSHTDAEEAVAASHRLNDYLTDVAYRSIKPRK